MPWLINNSTKCKYWTYSYDQKLLNIISNHYKKFSSKPLKLKAHNPCKNNYTIEHEFSDLSSNRFIDSFHQNSLKKLFYKIKNHYSTGHDVIITIDSKSNLNTRGFNKIKKKVKNKDKKFIDEIKDIIDYTKNDLKFFNFDDNTTIDDVKNFLNNLKKDGVSVTYSVSNSVGYYTITSLETAGSYVADYYTGEYNTIKAACGDIDNGDDFLLCVAEILLACIKEPDPECDYILLSYLAMLLIV